MESMIMETKAMLGGVSVGKNVSTQTLTSIENLKKIQRCLLIHRVSFWNPARIA